MDKYLLLLLKEVNTIIIPDLGALTITNHSTGEIMFMPFLKYDDGKLAAYISEKEGFELNDAKNLISKYVRDVQAVLDRGESYDMFQFGTFLKDKSGEIIFRNWDGSMPSEIKNEVLTNQIVEEIVSLEDSDSIDQEHKSIQESLEQDKEIKNEVPDIEVNTTEQTSNGYQNDIEGITITSNKDLEINIGEKHILAIRNEGNIELLKDGVLLENYAELLPKSEIVKPLAEVKEKKVRTVIEPKVEIKEEINSPEVIAPVQTELVVSPRPKVEFTPAELEAKKIKNAEREAERERRLAERMEKLAMKGMPEETKEEESSKPEVTKEKVKPTAKKEKKVKESKRAFVVQKTPNQKSSILIAISIVSVGLIGGLGIILYNSGDISSPKLVEPKELAENNKNIESTEDISSAEESSTKVVVETADIEEVSVPAMEEKASTKVEEVKPTVKSIEKPKATSKQAPVVSKPVTSSSEGKYHIVGGSFSVKVNAENFVNQMIAKGLDAKLLGKIDKMYIVSIGSYTSKREAITESKTIGVKGWIFKQN
jgi:nucleoid DNA-binding protein